MKKLFVRFRCSWVIAIVCWINGCLCLKIQSSRVMECTAGMLYILRGKQAQGPQK